MKIVSDFDGVWTNPAGEAAWVEDVVQAELARVSGLRPTAVGELLHDVRRRIAAHPERYGWAPDGRIAAYVDEDLFGVGDALVGCLALHRSEKRLGAVVDALLSAGFESPGAFADHCFRLGGETYRAAHPPALVPGAQRAFETLRERGHEVVIVSNARAEKVTAWLGSVGIDAGVGPGHGVRVRGEAGKQVIGSGLQVRFCGRSFYVDRPRYRTALAEEQADLVIGDVFSLDLLAAHRMRAEGLAGAPRWLVLRRQAHTPRWVWRGRVEGAVDALVDDAGALASCAERLVR